MFASLSDLEIVHFLLMPIFIAYVVYYPAIIFTVEYFNSYLTIKKMYIPMIKNDVGMNAGNILSLLSDKGKLTIREIGEFTHYKDKVIFIALGWLLREDKISCVDRDGALYFEPKVTCLSEIYY